MSISSGIRSCLFLVSISFGFAQPPAPSAACLRVQEECHKDTDCLHRAIYLHSTCVTGSCQPQCKTAVLNLYQTEAGRNLLESDLSCLASVKSDMDKCGLIPTQTPMHCTLARFVCQANDTCRAGLDVYEAKCTGAECSGECGKLLDDVSAGGPLHECTCWSHDPLCAHFRNALLNPPCPQTPPNPPIPEVEEVDNRTEDKEAESIDYVHPTSYETDGHKVDEEHQNHVRPPIITEGNGSASTATVSLFIFALSLLSLT